MHARDRIQLVIALFVAYLAGCAHAAGSAGMEPRRADVSAVRSDLRCLERNLGASLQIDLFFPGALISEVDLPTIAASPSSRAQGTGSGTVVSRDGHILTAAHLMKDAGLNTLARVLLADPGSPLLTAYVARVVAVDEKYDIALLKVDRHFDRVAPIGGPAETRPGDETYSVGFPFDIGLLVARGFVMGVGVNLDADVTGRMILDMRSGPGGSGAGVYSPETGNLIGVYQGTRAMLVHTDPIFLYDFVRWAAPVSAVRRLLDAARVPYERAHAPGQDCGPAAAGTAQ